MKSLMHTIIFVAFFLAALLGAAGCGSDYSSNSYSGNPPPNIPANTVVMSGMAFSPGTITVSSGTTITWDNRDGTTHTSTADGGAWNTGNIPAGGSRTTTFNTPGSFPYHCGLHPSMRGTVVVN